jgi:hypothetical protein
MRYQNLCLLVGTEAGAVPEDVSFCRYRSWFGTMKICLLVGTEACAVPEDVFACRYRRWCGT